MVDPSDIEKAARAALEREPRVNLHRSPIAIRVEDGGVRLEGEVASIEEKRVATACVESVARGRRVLDRLRVKPAVRPGDGAIRDGVCRRLFEEPVFLRMTITCRLEGDAEARSRNPDDPDGTIEASVRDGVVTLRGEVWSLSHRRLAEVLAWWTPGVVNVINELAIRPDERDNDAEISDAIDLVLDMDPLVHRDQITLRVQNGRVVLRGLVANDEERRMAARDAWYVEGVRDVVNELQTLATGEPLRATPPGME